MAQRTITVSFADRSILSAFATREISLGDSRVLFDPAFFDPAFFVTTGRSGWVPRTITSELAKRAVTFSNWRPV